MKATLPLFATLLSLAVTTAVQAGADNFANATDLSSNNWPGAVSINDFTVEVGEPNHRINGGTSALKSAWWKWTAPANGFCTVDTMSVNSDDYVYDTVVAVYTGNAVNALTRVAASDDHYTHLSQASANSASATFYATQGTTYRIAVDGYNTSSVNANNDRVRLHLRHLHAIAEQRMGVFGFTEEEEGEFMHGLVQLNKTAGHAFSGKLLLTGKTYPFKGVFGLDGYATLTIERKVAPGAPPQPPLTLFLDGSRGSEFIVNSHLFDYGSELPLHTRQTYATGVTSGLEGRFTATVGHTSNNAWKGGNLTFTVSGAGAVKGAGVLPDGTKITFGSSVCVNDPNNFWVPLYCPLYKSQGFFCADLKMTFGGDVDQVTAERVKHFRPEAPGSTFMPAGMALDSGISIRGATYTPPAANLRALGFLDGTAGAGTLSLPMVTGELDPAIMENLTLSTSNVFGFSSSARKPVLKLNKATGLVTGSLVDDGGLKRTLTGVLFLDGMTPKLHGHVSGTTQNVFFEVVP